MDPSSPSHSRPDPDSRANADPNPEAKAALTIWLVEDSTTDAFVIGEILKLADFQCELRVISDGDVALTMLRSVADANGAGRPDLVLLDLNVPKVSGVEVLSALRGSGHCSDVPVIIVTSSDSTSDMQAIRQLGATAYFKKPHDLDEFMSLSEVIKQALHHRDRPM